MNKELGFKDGQSFYFLAPGCNQIVSEKMRGTDIKLAFSTSEKIKSVFTAFPNETADKMVAYYGNYKRGILDTMEKYPMNVPEKLKKLVARLNK